MRQQPATSGEPSMGEELPPLGPAPTSRSQRPARMGRRRHTGSGTALSARSSGVPITSLRRSVFGRRRLGSVHAGAHQREPRTHLPERSRPVALEGMNAGACVYPLREGVVAARFGAVARSKRPLVRPKLVLLQVHAQGSDRRGQLEIIVHHGTQGRTNGHGLFERIKHHRRRLVSQDGRARHCAVVVLKLG
jgi:hypothetical protein